MGVSRNRTQRWWDPSDTYFVSLTDLRHPRSDGLCTKHEHTYTINYYFLYQPEEGPRTVSRSFGNIKGLSTFRNNTISPPSPTWGSSEIRPRPVVFLVGVLISNHENRLSEGPSSLPRPLTQISTPVTSEFVRIRYFGVIYETCDSETS